jgi:drug/metabolite transporter (DMT)-like permease
MVERTPLAAAALVFNAFVWGVSWWPFRELQAQGLHALWATAFVYLFCLCCALAVRPRALAPFAREPRLWLLAAACGLTNVGFNWGVTVGDVVRVVLLFYLMPAWSVLLAWPLLGERPNGASLTRLALALAGVLAVLHAPGTGLPLPRDAADWLALAGGFSFALTNILLRKLRTVPTESRVVAMFGGGAVLASLTAGVGQVGLPPPSGGWLLLALGLGLAFLASNLCLQYGASRLPAPTTALVMLSEVVFASLSSIALGAAELTPRVLAGGVLIMAAALWAAWPKSGAQSPP